MGTKQIYETRPLKLWDKAKEIRKNYYLDYAKAKSEEEEAAEPKPLDPARVKFDLYRTLVLLKDHEICDYEFEELLQLLSSQPKLRGRTQICPIESIAEAAELMRNPLLHSNGVEVLYSYPHLSKRRPEDFGLEKLADFGDTRAELVAIALKYEEAMIRQKPLARLIEEVRLLDFGAEQQEELDKNMMLALEAWIRGKPAAKGMSRKQVAALLISVIGGWLFYLSTVRRSEAEDPLRDTLLDEWASLWASVLDGAR